MGRRTIGGGKTDSVDISVFDTHSAPSRDQYALWRESIGVIFDVTDGEPLERAGYSARLESALVGSAMITRVKSGHQQFTRDSLRFYRDGLDSVMFQVFLRGEVRKADDAVRLADSYALVGFDLTRAVDNINSEFDLVSIIFPREALTSRGVDPASIHLKVLGQDGGLAAVTARMVLDLQAQLPTMDVEEAEEATRAAIDLIAACFRGDTRRQDSRSACCEALLLRARDLIQANISGRRRVDADLLMNQLGCSRATLYRAFEPVGGVARFIRSARLKMALGHIAKAGQDKNGRPLGEIASLCGFESDSHFSRTFKKEFGLSPSGARGLFEHSDSIERHDDGHLDRRYEFWLRSIS